MLEWWGGTAELKFGSIIKVIDEYREGRSFHKVVIVHMIAQFTQRPPGNLVSRSLNRVSIQFSISVHVPYFQMAYSDEMSFVQRLANLAMKLWTILLHVPYHSMTDSINRMYLPDAPSSSELLANLSGCMINQGCTKNYCRLTTIVNLLPLLAL